MSGPSGCSGCCWKTLKFVRSRSSLRSELGWWQDVRRSRSPLVGRDPGQVASATRCVDMDPWSYGFQCPIDEGGTQSLVNDEPAATELQAQGKFSSLDMAQMSRDPSGKSYPQHNAFSETLPASPKCASYACHSTPLFPKQQNKKLEHTHTHTLTVVYPVTLVWLFVSLRPFLENLPRGYDFRRL